MDEEMSKKTALYPREKLFRTPSAHKNEQDEAIYTLKSSV